MDNRNINEFTLLTELTDADSVVVVDSSGFARRINVSELSIGEEITNDEIDAIITT